MAQNRSVTQSDQRSQPTQADQAAQEEVEYKEEEEAETEAMEEEEADQAESLADEGERSDTAANIQVSGVDAPDVIKTDGEHFYVLDSEQLSIITIAEDGLELRSTVPFDSPGDLHTLGEQQLLLAGNTLLALRTVGINYDEWWSHWATPPRGCSSNGGPGCV